LWEVSGGGGGKYGQMSRRATREGEARNWDELVDWLFEVDKDDLSSCLMSFRSQSVS